MAYTKVSITSKAVFVLGQTSLGCDTVTSQQEKTQHQTFGPCNSWTTLISFSFPINTTIQNDQIYVILCISNS